MKLLWMALPLLGSGCADILPHPTAPVAGLNYHPPEAPEKVLELLPGAKDVRVGKSDAPQEAAEIGAVEVSDGEGCGKFGTLGTFGRVMIKLKNAAWSGGGDYVQILTITEPHMDDYCFHDEYHISGMAYKTKVGSEKAVNEGK